MVLVFNDEEKNHDIIQLECDSIYGKGYLYITKTFFVLEATNKNLIYFEILHTQIVSLKASSNHQVEICWIENGTLQKFTFRLNDAFSYVKKIVEKYDYTSNFPDILGSDIIKISQREKQNIIDKRLLFCNKKIKEYELLLSEANNRLSSIKEINPNDTQNTIKESEIISDINNTLTMWNMYKDDIPRIEINRHGNIPRDIQNHWCWFDCWYDEKTKLYITFNFKFLKLYSFDFHKDVKKFKENNTIPNVCAIPEEFVGFVNGYPSIMKKHVKEFFEDIIKDKTIPSIIIPNITDEMLNDELISKWHGVSIEIDQIKDSYQTIPINIYYYLNKGSRIILTNSVRCRYSQKERIFLEKRDAFPEKHKPFLP